MKVAFASEDGTTVNAHFGHSMIFAVYDVSREGYELVEIRRVTDKFSGDEHGRIENRIAAIEDCALVFMMQIGASAAARVTRKKIMPVKVAMGSPIEVQLKRLQELIKEKPPLWLSKIIHEEEERGSERGKADVEA